MAQASWQIKLTITLRSPTANQLNHFFWSHEYKSSSPSMSCIYVYTCLSKKSMNAFKVKTMSYSLLDPKDIVDIQ